MRVPAGVPAFLVLGLALGCAGASGAGPSRQTVETRVTASGEDIFLRWSDRHPWDADLIARGALLVAEYRTRDGGVALDCLGGGDPPAAGGPAARRRPAAPRGPAARTQACMGLTGEVARTREDRTLRFRLPRATTATPDGPVCLYFRLPNQRVLPLRRADGQGTETARFRYPGWEAAAANEAAFRVLEARVEQLHHAVDVKAQDVAAQESINARNRWSSRGGCEGIQPPDVTAGRSGRPLAEPADQEDIARRVCMMRVWYADSLMTGLSLPERLQEPVVQPPAVVDRLLALLPAGRADPALAARRAQATAYRRDWDRLASGMRSYRDGIMREGWQGPHFGGFRDRLSLQTVTAEAGLQLAEALARRERADQADVAGVAGGMLEAYTRCVSDGQQQLATSYRNAMELRARAPAVRESMRQSMVRECHGGIDRLETLRAEHAGLVAELAEAEARQSAFARGSALPASAPDLNTAVCRP